MSFLPRVKNWLFENRSPSQAVAKNTTWLVIGQIISRILRAALVIYAARALGAESWGAFSYALAIATFLTTFSDFGTNALLTKEVAREPKSKDKYLSTTFFIKIVLLILLFIAALLSRNFLTNIPEVRAIIPILIFVFAFDTLRDFGASLMRAFERMEIEAFLTVFANLAIVVLGFIFIFSKATSISLAYAYALGSAIGFLMTIFILRSHLKNIFKSFDRNLVKKIIVTAWPFGLMTLLGIIMLNTDIIVIGWLRDAKTVGFYAAGQKLTQLLYVLPTLFASALFPGFARLAEDREKNHHPFRARLEKSLTLTFLIALPLTLGGLILGDQVISLFFGSEYGPSRIVFQILAFTFLIVFPSIVMSNALFALGERKEFVKAVIIGILSNLLANLILIPPFGLAGAAIATIVSQLLTNFFFWKKMRAMIGFKILPYLKKITSATITMSLIILVLRLLSTNVLSNIVVAMVVYLGVLYVLKEETLFEIKKVYSS
jgi:O-antigen/teichoic acid export membrane protein